MKKALQTLGLTALIAAFSLLAVLGLMGVRPGVDLDPNAILVRRLMTTLRDGDVFTLTQAYPEAWDTAQVFTGGEPMTEWQWRTLRQADEKLAALAPGEQALVFWRDGAVAFAVRFTQGKAGEPWFTNPSFVEEGPIYPRDSAVFRAALVRDGNVAYYLCSPENGDILL